MHLYFIVGFFVVALIIFCVISIPQLFFKKKTIDEANTEKQFPNHACKLYFILSQSGGGKDTQAGKILQLFQEQGVKYIYISMGDQVRGTLAELGPENAFARNMKMINDAGKLQPASIPIHFFLAHFIPHYTGNEVVVVNGSPRSDKVLKLWGDLIQSGHIPPARIIHLDVTDEECRKRLKSRPGRPDTEDDAARETKLAWYKPIRKFLRNRLPEGMQMVTINGMKSPEHVFESLKNYFVAEAVLNE